MIFQKDSIRKWNGMDCRFLYNSTQSGALLVIEEIATKYQHEVWLATWEKCPLVYNTGKPQ